LRQAAVPLGGALASITLPAVVARSDARVGLVALAAACFVAAVACAGWLREPPGVAAIGGGRGPLRDRRVYRLALGSGCLVSLQAAVIGFIVLFLHDQRGLSDVAAGAVLAVIQVVGVVLRIVVGRWSDRAGRRLSLLRRTAAVIAVVWLVTPFLFGLPVSFLIPVVVLAGAITFAWNGLSFAAAAELAEPGRSGTAIAIQQTALFAVAALVPPLFGAVASATSYRVAFWSVVAGPVLGWILLRPLAIKESAPAGG
jgi:MFS family permease